MDNKYYQEGVSKYRKRDFEGAIIDFTYALEKDPDNPYIHYERGMSYFHLNKKNLALMDLDKALELQPNNPYRYSSRAYMKDACGDIIGAISDYKTAIELDPEDAVAHNNLGLLEEKMGRMSKAKRHFDQADKLAKDKDEFKHLYTAPKESPTGPVIEFNQEKKQDEISSQTAVEEQEDQPAGFSDYVKVIAGIFSSKESFKEFITFVKRGFKF